MTVRNSFILLLFLLIATGDLPAQWNIVTPAPIGKKQPIDEGGAIRYFDGILWAGYTGLTKSEDFGKTWAATALPSTVQVIDIAFCNKDTGVVAAYDGIYRTTDRGTTWQQVSYESPCFHIAYNNSASVIHAIKYSTGDMLTSIDGGLTWNTQHITGQVWTFAIAKDRTIYVVGSTGAKDINGYLYTSSDLGNSWRQLGGTLGKDSYSIDIDSCLSSTFYVANDSYWLYDPYSRLYVTANAGASWSSTLAQPRPYIAGSMAISGQAQFVGTLTNGLLRSTDHGNSWINIGGPINSADSRAICALDNNHLFVLDTFGNVWATGNSGGSLIRSQPVMLSSSSLFDRDTLACGHSLPATSYLQYVECAPARILGYSLSGSDTASYAVTILNRDSLVVTFTSLHPNAQPAQLTLIFSDSSTKVIVLNGSGLRASVLSVTSSDQHTDTIGATVQVPITIAGLLRPEDVELALHYSGDAEYLGSFDASGKPLDIPNEPSPGRSKLHVTQARSATVIGYARFRMFSDSTATAAVTFDSIDILTATPCEYILHDTSLTVILSSPSECGTGILSTFLRGLPLTLNIRPNPTTGTITIQSPADLGISTIEVYDALGIKKSTISASIPKDSPVALILPGSEGMYYVRVRSVYGEAESRVILRR